MSESNSPNALRSQIITTITTTTFKIFLIVPSMGMYELTSHRRTPATIKTSIIVKSDIINLFKFNSKVIYPGHAIVTQLLK
jgi:hypothetical protein